MFCSRQIRWQVLFVILCIHFSNYLFAQSFIGKYRLVADDVHATFTISINKDKTYQFLIEKSLSNDMSQGTWTYKKDTIELVDNLVDTFDIIVKESFDKSRQGVKFNYVIYPDSTFETSAGLEVNDDPGSFSLISTGQVFEAGVVKKFRIRVRDNFISKEYKVKSKRANVFDIIINMSTPLAYSKLILKGVKLVIKNENTIEWVDSTSTSSPFYLYRINSSIDR